MSDSLFKNFDSLPELLSSDDLVKIGLYSSIDAAYTARKRGESPAFIQFKRKVLYPKESVIKFLLKNLYNGEENKETE